jgi:hypothetical protein
MARIGGGWNLFGESTVVELGKVVRVYHPERIGTSATTYDDWRVLSIEVDPLVDRVTLECMRLG